jgi:hypothetical protein
MKMPWFSTISTLAVILVLWTPAILSNTTKPTLEVPIEQIHSGHVKVIGRLGIPIGRVVTLRIRPTLSTVSGKHDLEDIPAVEVHQIDDQALDMPVRYIEPDYKILLPRDAQLKDGDNVVIGYELAHFEGFPPGTWNMPTDNKEKRKQISPIRAPREFGFYSTLYIVKSVENAE